MHLREGERPLPQVVYYLNHSGGKNGSKLGISFHNATDVAWFNLRVSLESWETYSWEMARGIGSPCKQPTVASPQVVTAKSVLSSHSRPSFPGRRYRLSEFILVLKMERYNMDPRWAANSWLLKIQLLLCSVHTSVWVREASDSVWIFSGPEFKGSWRKEAIQRRMQSPVWLGCFSEH